MHPEEKVNLLNIYKEKLNSKCMDKRGMQMTREREKKKKGRSNFSLLNNVSCLIYFSLQFYLKKIVKGKKDNKPQ